MIQIGGRSFLLVSILALVGFAWIPAGDTGINRFRHGATLLPSGRVLVAGGNAGTDAQPTATAQLFLAPSTWTPAASMAQARFLHTQTLLSDGRVLVAGGHPGPVASAEIYDPATDTWTAAAPMNRARAQHTASLLKDGRVAVVGGLPGPETGLADVEIYDPATNTWTLVAPLNIGRYDHAAVVLGDGRLLIIGGNSGVDQISTCEVYDPALNLWILSVSLYRRRQLPTTALLPDGKVLVAAGLSYDLGLTAELIDLANPSGTLPAGSLLQDRYYQSGAVLPDGRVLIVGGYGTPNSGPLASAELYDPAANSWSAVGSMSVARYYHSATTLANGRVVIVGGIGTQPYPSAAEVWLWADTVPPVITAPSLIVAEMTSPLGAVVTIPATAVDDVDGPVPVTSDAPSIFPQGDTTVHLSAMDKSGNVATLTVTVRVVDTKPPTIHSVVASPSVLSPARGQMVPVTIAVQATDIADPSPTSRITAVASTGGPASDWMITGPLSISLRAARITGSSLPRVYTITVTCSDRSGNSSSAAVTVQVQK